MIAKEQALEPSFGVHAHDGMIDCGRSSPLCFGHRIFAMPACARKIEVVNRSETCNSSFHDFGQRLVSPVRVGKVCLAAFARNFDAVDQRGLRCPLGPRTVRVPIEGAAIGMPTAGLAVVVQVRKKEKLWMLVVVVLVQYVRLYFTEPASKLDVTCRSQLLVAEQQNLKSQESIMNCREDMVTYVVGKVHASDFRDEGFRKRPDDQGGIEICRSRRHESLVRCGFRRALSWPNSVRIWLSIASLPQVSLAE